jgi:hypothetical protein
VTIETLIKASTSDMYNKTEYETATIEAHIKSLFLIDFKPI